MGATLHPAGTANIETSAQAAEALKPLAGTFAFALFSLGIVGTGLLSIPVLAGSAAYAAGEALKWRVGLSLQPMEGRAFYGTIAIATLIGVAINFTSINPIEALYYSAVINGVASVPIIAIMMHVATDQNVMGRFAVNGWLSVLGWLTVAVMAIATFAMLLQGLSELSLACVRCYDHGTTIKAGGTRRGTLRRATTAVSTATRSTSRSLPRARREDPGYC